MAKVLELVVLVFGIVTLFFAILALSLDYWQGRTVTVNQIVEWQIDQFPKGKQMFVDFKQRFAGVPIGVPKSLRWTLTTPPGDTGPSDGFSNINRLGDMVLQQQDGTLNQDTMSMILGVKMYLHVGLWHICIKDVRPKIFFVPFTGICADMNDGMIESGMVHVPQLMFFLGIFLTIACLVLVGIILISTEEKPRLIDITALIILMSGIFYTAGFAYFVENMAVEILDYQTAFYLGLFAALFCFAMTGMLMYLKFCKARGTVMK